MTLSHSTITLPLKLAGFSGMRTTTLVLNGYVPLLFGPPVRILLPVSLTAPVVLYSYPVPEMKYSFSV